MKYMKLKNKLHNLALTTLTLLMLSAATVMTAQTPADWKKLKGNVTMYLANDLGRNVSSQRAMCTISTAYSRSTTRCG